MTTCFVQEGIGAVEDEVDEMEIELDEDEEEDDTDEDVMEEDESVEELLELETCDEEELCVAELLVDVADEALEDELRREEETAAEEVEATADEET